MSCKCHEPGTPAASLSAHVSYSTSLHTRSSFARLTQTDRAECRARQPARRVDYRSTHTIHGECGQQQPRDLATNQWAQSDARPHVYCRPAESCIRTTTQTSQRSLSDRDEPVAGWRYMDGSGRCRRRWNALRLLPQRNGRDDVPGRQPHQSHPADRRGAFARSRRNMGTARTRTRSTTWIVRLQDQQHVLRWRRRRLQRAPGSRLERPVLFLLAVHPIRSPARRGCSASGVGGSRQPDRKGHGVEREDVAACQNHGTVRRYGSGDVSTSRADLPRA